MKNLDKDIFKKIAQEIDAAWQNDIIPQLVEYIKIPNKSPAFDTNWKANGHMNKAVDLIVKWCSAQPIADMNISVLEEEGHTPLILIDIPGQKNDHSVLLYGHLDKQPEMRGWDADLGPWQPVLRNGKLYGRGGADDGYAVFAALTAIATLQRHQIPHAHCVLLVEASEESGSIDLTFYLKKLQDKIIQPSFIVCLDSGCGNYQQLWGTTSLRGLINATLRIEVLKKGMHSGVGSGVVPSTFQILRLLLDRIEDSQTGKMLVEQLTVSIPQPFQKQAKAAGDILSEQLIRDYPFLQNVAPLTNDLGELILNRTWWPALSVVGIDGLPGLAQAGNVTIPNLSAKLSIRIPPGCHPEQGAQVLKKILEAEPPFGAHVTFNIQDLAPGWQAPILADWLEKANEEASQLFFNKPAAYLGEGGTIPFMGMLGAMFPKAQFLITGVLGPDSSAHGPNEFLHIDMAKKLTSCVTAILAAHYYAS